jgi:hypothetical protein
MNDANFTGLAWPDQTLNFDSASPGAVLYTSPDYAYKNVTGQRYPGNIARYFDPTRRGGTPPSISNVKDKIVMTIRNGEMQNEFILRYDVYSASVSSGNVIAYTWQFYVDALNQRFNRIIMRDAVVTAIDAVTGLVTKRTDNIDAKRALVAERAMPSTTVLTYNTTGAPAHAANLIATVSSSLTVPNSGQVRFYEGTTLLGTSNVNTSGVATLAYTWPSAGTRSITAKYSGDGDSWTASTSAAVVVSVT